MTTFRYLIINTKPIINHAYSGGSMDIESHQSRQSRHSSLVGTGQCIGEIVTTQRRPAPSVRQRCAHVLLAMCSALALTGCAAKFTLIDRSNGQLSYGTTEGGTTGASGQATLVIDGETYTGPWIYQPNGGSFGFTNFGASATGSANATAFNSQGGFATANVSANSTMTGSSSSMTVSAVGNGMINAREPGGKFIRCVFTFHTMQNTGIGECLRNDGRVFDLNIKR